MTPSGHRHQAIALAVTGSSAALEAASLARLLVARGRSVLPLMSPEAARLAGTEVLREVCKEPVVVAAGDEALGAQLESLSERADVVAIAPASADVLARLAAGFADELIAALALAARGPVVVAPAMHPRMWRHPATQRNVEVLARRGGVRVVGPVGGPLGEGRMESPAVLASVIEGLLSSEGDLTGRRLVVTAGPTFEPIDPVRFLGNRSSGKMGFALAARAAARGASVALVAGPVALATPPGVERQDVETAEEMRAALAALLGPDLTRADALVMAAAVADFRPSAPSATKIKKARGEPPAIPLARNVDLIAEIAAKRTGSSPVLVAFALETGDDAHVLAYAREKLSHKRVDVVVANAAHESLGNAEGRVALVEPEGGAPFFAATKEVLADRILDRVASLLRTREG